MSKKNIEDKYKVLDQISHVLLRPGTYVGSNKPNKSNRFIINKNQIDTQEITFIPSFLKIFDEVIVNSIDEHKRNPKLNRIDVFVDKEKITIKDNGGIPVIMHKKHKQYVPEVVFGNLMSGSNYNDGDKRKVAGLNGLGAKLANIFSEKFIITTCDGKKQFTQTYTNNMRKRNKASVKSSKLNKTEITFYPDFKQFDIDEIDEHHYKMIEKRVYDLAGCNPKINIYFNKKKINFKSFKDYVKLYKDDFIYEESKDKNWNIAISNSENGFQQVSFSNSTETYDGGTHLDYILNQIINELRMFFKKKHKYDVKPSELKQHIFIFINSTVINPSFSSQTKEKLITEVKDFGTEYKVSKALIQSIIKSEIIESVLDWINQKKIAEENKVQRKLNSKLSKIKVDKLIDAKGKTRWKCSLSIFEGDSASSSFRKFRTPELMGSFSLGGKFINVSDISNKKLVNNKEAVNLMAAIGLKLGKDVNIKDLRYGRILLYMDADTDGNSIAAQLMNFFYTYWPELFERKMIYKAETPIVVAQLKVKKGKGKKLLFYTNEEYQKWLSKADVKKWEIKYKKGLAALVDDEYKDIIQDPKLTLLEIDKGTKDLLNTWFGKSSDLRKKELL